MEEEGLHSVPAWQLFGVLLCQRALYVLWCSWFEHRISSHVLSLSSSCLAAG
jgi:hypothetical protein